MFLKCFIILLLKLYFIIFSKFLPVHVLHRLFIFVKFSEVFYHKESFNKHFNTISKCFLDVGKGYFWLMSSDLLKLKYFEKCYVWDIFWFSEVALNSYNKKYITSRMLNVLVYKVALVYMPWDQMHFSLKKPFSK